MSEAPRAAPREPTLDLREKGGHRDGTQQTSERRLFVQFMAFGECEDPAAVGRGLESAGLTGAVYADVHDPRGIGVVVLDENPEVFVTALRELWLKPPLASLRVRPEHALL